MEIIAIIVVNIFLQLFISRQFFHSCATPLFLLFCFYIQDFFFACFWWRGGQRGGEVEPMCENMRAKFQYYFEAIVRVVDVPVRNLRRLAFLLELLLY